MATIATETFSGSSAANFTVTHGAWSETGGAYDANDAGVICRAIHNTAMDTVNHESSALVGGRASTSCGSVMVNGHPTEDTGYLGSYNEEDNTDNIVINKAVNGSHNTLPGATATVSGAGAKVFRLVSSASGANRRLQLYVDTVLVIDVTDSSSPLSGVRVGVGGYNNANSRIDNFAAQDTAAATAAKGSPFRSALFSSRVVR